MLTASPFLNFHHFAAHVRNDGVGVRNFAMNIRDDGAGFIVMADIGRGSMRIQW